MARNAKLKSVTAGTSGCPSTLEQPENTHLVQHLGNTRTGRLEYRLKKKKKAKKNSTTNHFRILSFAYLSKINDI